MTHLSYTLSLFSTPGTTFLASGIAGRIRPTTAILTDTPLYEECALGGYGNSAVAPWLPATNPVEEGASGN